MEFVLYLIAFICFVLAAIDIAAVRRVNLIAVGLAAWVLVAVTNTWPG